MRILVAGVPGIGKTTILNFLKDRVEVSIVNFGSLMAEMAGMQRDEMRERIELSKYRKLQLKAARKIGRMKGNVIIDSHVAIRRTDGYYPGFPPAVMEAAGIDAIVLLEKDARAVARQARLDKSRKRTVNAGEIAEHMAMNRMYAAAYSAYYSIPVKIITIPYPEKRKFDGSRNAAKQLEELIRCLH